MGIYDSLFLGVLYWLDALLQMDMVPYYGDLIIQGKTLYGDECCNIHATSSQQQRYQESHSHKTLYQGMLFNNRYFLTHHLSFLRLFCVLHLSGYRMWDMMVREAAQVVIIFKMPACRPQGTILVVPLIHISPLRVWYVPMFPNVSLLGHCQWDILGALVLRHREIPWAGTAIIAMYLN